MWVGPCALGFEDPVSALCLRPWDRTFCSLEYVHSSKLRRNPTLKRRRCHGQLGASQQEVEGDVGPRGGPNWAEGADLSKGGVAAGTAILVPAPTHVLLPSGSIPESSNPASFPTK